MGAPWRPARVVSRLSAGALLEDFAARSGFLGRDLENPDRKPPIPEQQANFESRVRLQQVKNHCAIHRLVLICQIKFPGSSSASVERSTASGTIRRCGYRDANQLLSKKPDCCGP